jgi:hypothetical protein
MRARVAVWIGVALTDAERALHAIEAALKDETNSFRHAKTSTDRILDAAESAANLLEGTRGRLYKSRDLHAAYEGPHAPGRRAHHHLPRQRSAVVEADEQHWRSHPGYFDFPLVCAAKNWNTSGMLPPMMLP